MDSFNLSKFILVCVILIDFKSVKPASTATLTCPVDFYPSNGICVDCPAGTFGPACSYVCSSPYYGRRCLKLCECTVTQLCDPAVGCIYLMKTDEITKETGLAEVETKQIRSSVITRATLSTSNTSQIVSSRNAPIQTNRDLNIISTQPVLYVRLDYTLEVTTSDFENMETAAEIIEKSNGKENSTENFTNIIMLGVGLIVILLLIVIIVVQIRSKQKKRRQNNRDVVSFVRERSSTYCEIEDRLVPSTSEYHRVSDNRRYELIREAERESTKYSTLPTVQRSDDRNSYLIPNSTLPTCSDCSKEMNADNAHTKLRNQSKNDADSHYTPLPTKQKATIDCEDNSTLLPVAMKIPEMKATIECENNSTLLPVAVKIPEIKENGVLDDFQLEKIDSESPVLLRKVNGSRVDKAQTVTPTPEETTRSYIDMNKGTFVEYESMESQSDDNLVHNSEIDKN